MPYPPKLFFRIALLFFLLRWNALQAQQSPVLHPPDYPGVKTFIPGVFITPIPGAPFSGTVVRKLAEIGVDAEFYVGRVILSSHVYDPQTRLSTFLVPETHIARQMVLSTTPQAPENSTPDTAVAPANAQNLTTRDLGNETVAGLILHGTRKVRTVPANLSGTGHNVTITDDYWYSEDLRVYLVLKHNDPRTGEQIVGIVTVDRKEPDPSTFQIPPTYKIVNETPVEKIRR